MKKTYQKPAMYAESFRLTEHISSGCSPSPTGPQEPKYGNFNNSKDCVYYLADGLTLFNTGSQDCLIPVDPGAGIVENCYNLGFTEEFMPFSS